MRLKGAHGYEQFIYNTLKGKELTMKRFFALSIIKNLKLTWISILPLLFTAFACSSLGIVKPSLNMSKTTYDAHEAIVVNFANIPANSTDWIGIFAAGASHEAYLRHIYSDGAANGTMRFNGLPTAGEYNARLFFKDSYNPEYEVSFTVGGDSQKPTATFTQPPAGTVPHKSLLLLKNQIKTVLSVK
ncbi:MAG: hypothetical protein ACMUIP_06370 [bacterium]